MMKLVFLGAPGSGKGTMASDMKDVLAIPHISTGDIFRANISENTELGQKAKDYLSNGKLVPDEITINMVRDRLNRIDCKDGFILDGFPRTVPQAEALDSIDIDGDCSVDLVINLLVPEEILFERITNRRVCSNCGAIYNLKNNPPKVEGVCDICSGEVIQRKDDTPETLRVRLDSYYDQTSPLVSYYRKQGKLLEFDNTGQQNDEKVNCLISLAKAKIREINSAVSADAASEDLA